MDNLHASDSQSNFLISIPDWLRSRDPLPIISWSSQSDCYAVMDLEHDALPPLPQIHTPTSIKQSRLKSSSSHPALITSTVLSTPSPTEVISTLINSLTALSESAREQLRRELDTDDPIPSHTVESGSIHRPENSDLEDLSQKSNVENAPQTEDDLNDEDVAAAPVVRFSRSPPRLKRKSRKNLFIHTNASWSQQILSPRLLTPRRSMQSLVHRDEYGIMGRPSVERLNGSTTSLPFSTTQLRSPREPHLSTLTCDQTPVKSLQESPLSSVAQMSDDAQPEEDAKQEMNHPRGETTPTPSPVEEKASPAQSHTSPSSTDTHSSSAINALSPLSRSDLRDRLIPYRRSSLGRGARNVVDGQDGHRHSTGSRDLKSLSIDDDLIEDDNSTVRRIRQLQEAREQRQKEWRSEARKSEKPSKRLSLPSPATVQRQASYQSTKLTIPEIREEKENDSSVRLSARITAADLADMPTILPSPVAPSFPLNRPPSPAPSVPATIAGTTIEPQSTGISKHRRRISTQLRRSSTLTSSSPEVSTIETKAISEEVDAFLGAPRLTQKIRHPRTGRTIAFSEVGDPNGFVVLCCVGMGLTRYITAFYDELARTLKLRLITPERPGVGESQSLPDGPTPPLSWVDDVAVICSTLDITRFSLLAHSAGAIYAFATALKMPQYVRGRIHLLAPWIPPSQMPKGALRTDSQPLANLPFSHRILSVLPSPILKVANSRFLSATSASVEPRGFLTSKKMKHLEGLDAAFASSMQDLSRHSIESRQQAGIQSSDNASQSCYQANNDTLVSQGVISRTSISERKLSPTSSRAQRPSLSRPMSPQLSSEARQALYNTALTHRIWSLSTLNANPALDLLVCLERRRTIGFRYPEVTRSVVIHHGAQDTRVPLDNIKWLQTVMKRCELRVIENEGHGLMASASVMSTVFTEIAKEWEEWEKIHKEKEKRMKEEAEKAEKASIATKARRHYR